MILHVVMACLPVDSGVGSISTPSFYWLCIICVRVLSERRFPKGTLSNGIREQAKQASRDSRLLEFLTISTLFYLRNNFSAPGCFRQTLL